LRKILKYDSGIEDLVSIFEGIPENELLNLMEREE
jgi:hypothetical protein